MNLPDTSGRVTLRPHNYFEEKIFVLCGFALIGKEAEVKNSIIEGSWTSTDDSKYQIQIKGNEWYDLYEGEKPGTFKFAFGDSCLADKNAKVNPAGKYVTIFENDGSRCFFIVSVKENKLELSYVGRGNTLTFKKKK